MNKKRFAITIVSAMTIITTLIVIILLNNNGRVFNRLKTALVNSNKESISVVLSKTTVQPGDIIPVKIYINTKGNSLEAFSLYLDYDPNILTVNGDIKKGAGGQGYSIVVSPSGKTNGHYKFSGMKNGDEGVDGNRHLVTINFKVADDIPDGSTALTLTVKELAGTNNEDEGLKRFDISTISNGMLNIVKIKIRADVDQDGETTVLDALLTLKKSVDYSLTELQKANWYDSNTTGDVDCDGEVTSFDALLILKKSVGKTEAVWCAQD